MHICFYKINEIADEKISFVVIITHRAGELLYVRHKERHTWEIPGGHREKGEGVLEAAKRELFEETGALEYSIKEITAYSVKHDNEESFGVLYFADVLNFGKLPNTEIAERAFFLEEPQLQTYHQIQPILLNYAKNILCTELGNFI